MNNRSAWVAVLFAILISACNSHNAPTNKADNIRANVAITKSQANSLELSDAEALRVIRESHQLPKPVAIELHVWEKDSPLVAEINRLINEGYLKSAGNDFYGSSSYNPTDKGKSLAKGAQWCVTVACGGGSWMFYPYTHEFDVRRLLDRRVDSTSKTISVMYEECLSPTKYLSQLTTLDPTEVDREVTSSLYMIKMSEFEQPVEGNCQTRTATLQKWESGWRVAEN